MIGSPLELTARKLARLGSVHEADVEAVAALPFRLQDVPAGATLVREGDVPEACCVLVDGFACRHKSTRSGNRQIVSFHIPGDILDVQHLQLPKADHDVAMITRGKVAWIARRDLRSLLEDRPALNDALWRDALIDASIFREWVLNVGRRDARTRISHMLCEFVARMMAAGLTTGDRIRLPMTQDEIADATGLTPVHVNRTIQALRQEGVFGGNGRDLEITDWQRLQNVADFDPAYLHQAA